MPKQTEPPPPVPTKPRIDVLERRLQNPRGEASSPIDLKDRAMVARVFNRAKAPQAIYTASQKGWEFVTPDMVEDMDQAGGFRTSTDGQRLVRGEREEEVLMFMPKTYRERIEIAKAEKNVADMRMGRQKDAVAQAAAQRFGSQAGDFLHAGRIVGDVTDKIERMHSVEDPSGS